MCFNDIIKFCGHKFFCLESIMARVKKVIKGNIVLTVAIIAALITGFIIPPDSNYLGYFDMRTLSCLFCTLAVICALKDVDFFYILAKKLILLCGNTRTVTLALIYITFIGSMIIANDMALITFLPLGYYILEATNKKHLMAYTFILQNIAANLGGMLTPFGNPQNLFLYSKFNIPNGEFMGIMVLPFGVAVLIITLCCLLVKKEDLIIDEEVHFKSPKKVALYLLLFLFSILIVFRIVPYFLGLIIVPLVLIFSDKHALKAVDYPLLLTFCAFFVFSGNMSRIEIVRDFFSAILEKNTLLVSAISCQFISNVPSAVLLSQFTENYPQLLVGVNIGGVGTLISSLASLITFREYTKRDPSGTKRYLLMFTGMNFIFLIVLYIVGAIQFKLF